MKRTIVPMLLLCLVATLSAQKADKKRNPNDRGAKINNLWQLQVYAGLAQPAGEYGSQNELQVSGAQPKIKKKRACHSGKAGELSQQNFILYLRILTTSK